MKKSEKKKSNGFLDDIVGNYIRMRSVDEPIDISKFDSSSKTSSEKRKEEERKKKAEEEERKRKSEMKVTEEVIRNIKSYYKQAVIGDANP
jgi:hypothetical protein